MAHFVKDPSDVLDYAVDWTAWLAGDTITSVTWTIPAGLMQVTESHTATTATVWLSGGTAGAAYVAACRVTTAGGRTAERSITILCQER